MQGQLFERGAQCVGVVPRQIASVNFGGVLAVSRHERTDVPSERLLQCVVDGEAGAVASREVVDGGYHVEPHLA